MRQPQADSPYVGHNGRMPPHAYVGTMGEPPVGRDEQIGQAFRNMRSAMKVSRETIARRLATSLSTIDNFEAGAIAALPHWKETARIVRGYCELLRMDPEPILWRVREQLQALGSQASPPPPPPRVLRPKERTAGSPDVAEAEPESTRPSRRRRRARTLFAFSSPLAFLLGVAILAQLMPGLVYRAVGLLPGVIESPARAGMDYVMLLTATRREGLKWIEVGDPRLRKADKLQTSTR
jgi:transcriptional regulator with XRE-family HTH domain